MQPLLPISSVRTVAEIDVRSKASTRVVTRLTDLGCLFTLWASQKIVSPA